MSRKLKRSILFWLLLSPIVVVILFPLCGDDHFVAQVRDGSAQPQLVAVGTALAEFPRDVADVRDCRGTGQFALRVGTVNGVDHPRVDPGRLCAQPLPVRRA